MKIQNKSLAVRASAAFAKEIGGLVIAFQKKCASAAADQIKLTNSARQIGLLIQEWSGGQITFGFWQEHKAALPAQVTFDMLKTFSSIASKLPEAASTLDQTRRCWQQEFEVGGLLQIPERQPQSASQRTKFMELVTAIASLRGVVAGWLQESPLAAWDPEQGADVKSQMQPLVEDFYEKL